MELTKLNDKELLIATDQAVDGEKAAVMNVTRHFVEVYRRKLYLPQYTSLFEMLRKKYKFCEPSAQLRLNAVRLMSEIPEVTEKIESGELSLTVAANIQSFLYRQKRQDQVYSEAAKKELIETCAHKSVVAAKKEFARRDPEADKRDVVRPTSADRVRVSHSSSTKLEENLTKIKSLWSHVDPNMSREDLLMRMSEIVLDRIDPVRKATRAKHRDERAAEPRKSARTTQENNERMRGNPNLLRSSEVNRSRYITADVQHEVHLKNEESGCEFVDDQTGGICRSKFQIQKDHIEPYSRGGSNSAQNLRMFCAAHNRWQWRSRSTY